MKRLLAIVACVAVVIVALATAPSAPPRSSGPSGPPAGTAWISYGFATSWPDRSGLVLRYPTGWHRQPYWAECGAWFGPGLWVSSVAFRFRLVPVLHGCTTRWDLRGLPAGAVALDLEPTVALGLSLPATGPVGSGVLGLPTDSVPTSAAAGEAGPAPAPTPWTHATRLRIPIEVGGSPYYVVNVLMRPGASAADRATASRIVSSIRWLARVEALTLAPDLPPGVSVAAVLRYPASVLAAGHGALYAITGPGQQSGMPAGRTARVVRVDPATGATTRSPVLPWPDSLLLAHGAVWVGGGGRFIGAVSSHVLYRLDPTTLAVLDGAPMPEPFGPMVPSPAGVWLASNRRLVLVDPSGARALATVPTGPRWVSALAADPAGRILYVGLSDGENAFVEELDAARGAILRPPVAAGGIVVGGLSATRTGVWASIAPGMGGYVAFLPERGQWGPQVHGQGNDSNGVRAYAIDHMVWVTDAADRLSCADPASGEVSRPFVLPLSPPGNPAFVTNPVQLGQDVYIGDGSQILRISPSICGPGL